jgi:hypothetical protein
LAPALAAQSLVCDDILSIVREGTNEIQKVIFSLLSFEKEHSPP